MVIFTDKMIVQHILREDYIMKKIISIITIIALFLTFMCVSVSADVTFSSLDEIKDYDLEQIKSLHTTYIKYNYDGKNVSFKYSDLTDDDLEYFLSVFSTQNLELIDYEIIEPVDATNPDYPDVGSWHFQVTGTYIQYDFSFNSEYVLVTYVFMDFSPGLPHQMKQAMFKFKDSGTYDELIARLDELAANKIEDDNKKQDEELEALNAKTIKDIDFLYRASYPRSDVSNTNDTDSWAVIQYTYEGESEPVTMLGVGYDILNFYRVTSVIDNNCFKVFNTSRKLQNYTRYGYVESDYKEKSWLYEYYSIQVNVNENMQAEDVTVTYKYATDGTTKTVHIDMSKYTQSGKLPTELFDPKYNVNYSAENEQAENDNENNDVFDEAEQDTTDVTVKDETTKEEEAAKEHVDEQQEQKTEQDITEKMEESEKTEEPEKQEETHQPNKEETANSEQTSEAPKVQDFIDVPVTHWAYEQIHEFSENKIVLGYGNGYFGTDDSITYEHFALLLDRLFEYEADNTQSIPAIREEVIVSLVKALKMDVSNADENIINKTFSDCTQLKEQNKKYIAAAIESGLVIGSDGKLFPSDALTRAETVMLLWRATR